MKKLVLLFALLVVALPVFAGDGAFNFFGNKVIDFAVVSRKSGTNITISNKYQNIIGFITATN